MTPAHQVDDTTMTDVTIMTEHHQVTSNAPGAPQPITNGADEMGAHAGLAGAGGVGDEDAADDGGWTQIPD